jgi:prepilin-type N-terminal cleavage/methylation domain-containing protein
LKDADMSHQRNAAFTLVELLVVIGIVAVLLALLLPALAAARRQSKSTACASNLRQICTALNAYAASNDGRLPDVSTSATGGNLWDVSKSFVNALEAQGVPMRTFLCPASQDITDGAYGFTSYTYFYLIQYNVWIERKNGTTDADVIPPSNAYAGTRFQIVSPRPAEPFAGPRRLSDPRASRNPVISDILGSNAAVTPPADADASRPGDPYRLNPASNHLDGLRVLGVNQGYIDGHVEKRAANEVRPYYRGNWWNWR